MRRAFAAICLTAAALTGITLAPHTIVPAADTTWGAPATTQATEDTSALPIVGDVQLPDILPLDTTWG
jgi:hypothetical protein